MSKYYIKKLGFQELGSPKPDGTVSRGRYMLISKKSEDFFPHLSETELNDTIIIPIITQENQEKIYCSYVFHNDKFHGSLAKSPRNEYRLYLNSKIDPNRSYFSPDDIVVFSKYIVDTVSTYQMTLIRKGQEHYDTLNEIIRCSSIAGGHTLYDGQLSFIEGIAEDNSSTIAIIPEEVKKDAKKKQEEIKQELTLDIETTKGANLFNSVSFRDFVLLGYQNKCAITNESIYYDNLTNLEVAHIRPKAHSGSFLPCNGIAMSRDMHWAFDRGMFTINEDFCVEVHEDVKNTLLGQYHEKKINLPIEDFFKPEPTFLKYHKENIFGLFKHAGVIRAN